MSWLRKQLDKKSCFMAPMMSVGVLQNSFSQREYTSLTRCRFYPKGPGSGSVPVGLLRTR